MRTTQSGLTQRRLSHSSAGSRRPRGILGRDNHRNVRRNRVVSQLDSRDGRGESAFGLSGQVEEAMVIRVFTTIVLAVLGIYAFWGDVLGGGHVLNPFGILFLLLATLTWFGWGPISEGFKSAKNESDLPISRLGSTIIKGMRVSRRGERPPGPT